ncbi:MAG: ATP-binding protein [Chloroflexi bacterium]|nr:ATP-binding protein [Chloroflexota bacterium]
MNMAHYWTPKNGQKSWFHSLSWKIVLAFLVVNLFGISLIALFARVITTYEFQNFLSTQTEQTLVARLSDYYQNKNSWQGASTVLRGVRVVTIANQTAPPAERIFFVVDTQGKVVVQGAGHGLNDIAPQELIHKGVPIKVNDQTVGRLIVDLSNPVASANAPGSLFSFENQWPLHNRFLGRVNQSLLYGAIGATAISLILGIFLARRLTHPLQEITAATRAVAQGDLNQQVAIRSNDELGELARSFNQMNASLAQWQHLRRQMTADIAHELRTPISIILGHAEGLSDGVLPASAETFHVIQDEAERLRRLVEDLRILSLTEAGELPMNIQLTPLHALLEQAVTAYTPYALQKEIHLTLEAAPNLPIVPVDSDRILQVLSNLLSNALRYTPMGGCIVVSARRDEQLQIAVQDSGAGIAPEELAAIFHRFYRGDKARHRQDGGSGLGLAIARSIIERHGGQIWAESTPGAGAKFTFTLPLSQTA